MGAFDTIDIAATGATTSQDWMDVLAHNLANVNTIRPGDEQPFRALLVQAQANSRGFGAGVRIVAVHEASGDPRLVFDPQHPLANADGYVSFPVIDIAGQMADLIIAQRSYQMNLQVIKNAQETYASALRIGR